MQDIVKDKNNTIDEQQPSADVANVDKIREILFGNQIKDFEHKFQQLQEQINKDINTLKNDSKRRIDTLESFVKSEFESLHQRLDGEQEVRIAEMEESTNKLESRIKLLDKRLSEQNKINNDKSRELRQLLLDQSKDLFEQMNQKQLDDRDLVNKVRDELDSEKVDRSALSSLFTELAMQVSGNDFSDDLFKSKLIK